MSAQAALVAFPTADAPGGEGDVCLSDRHVPSRSTCGQLGQLADEDWAPDNEYQQALWQALGAEPLSPGTVLTYTNKRQRRQEPAQSDRKVLFSSVRNGVSKARGVSQAFLPKQLFESPTTSPSSPSTSSSTSPSISGASPTRWPLGSARRIEWGRPACVLEKTIR